MLFKQLIYRIKLEQVEMKDTQWKAYALNVYFRRKRKAYSLFESVKVNGSVIETNPEKLGSEVSCILPCLDPDLDSKARKNKDLMGIRFLEQDDPVFDKDLKVTSEFLGNNYPVEYKFYPSEEVMKKLIIRMSSVKNAAEELWVGFEKVQYAEGKQKPEFDMYR